jgi:hypothetical protein
MVVSGCDIGNRASPRDPRIDPDAEPLLGFHPELVAHPVACAMREPPVLLLPDAAQGRIVQVLDGGRLRPAMRFIEVHRQSAPMTQRAERRPQGTHAHVDADRPGISAIRPVPMA